MPVPYGSMLVIALEEVIIPLIDSEQQSLAGYLLDVVNCESVGEAVYQEIELGNAGFYESLCITGVQAGAALILDQLRSIDDGGVTFTLNGTALPRDTNGDRKVDQLSQGEWLGSIDYDGTVSELEADKNTFVGNRMGN